MFAVLIAVLGFVATHMISQFDSLNGKVDDIQSRVIRLEILLPSPPIRSYYDLPGQHHEVAPDPKDYRK